MSKVISKIHNDPNSKVKSKEHSVKCSENAIKIWENIEFRRKNRQSQLKSWENNDKRRNNISNIQKGHIGYNKLTIELINKKYPLFSKIEEMRYNPDKPDEKEIQVHCKNHNCHNSKEQGGWFTPTGSQFSGRIYALEKDNGNDGTYLYCSDECKEICPLYGLNPNYELNFKTEKCYTDTEYYICRDEVFKRSDYKCEYCGGRAEHMHHIIPQKVNGFFSLDPDYCVACCVSCHYRFGHKDKCSTGKLANRNR